MSHARKWCVKPIRLSFSSLLTRFSRILNSLISSHLHRHQLHLTLNQITAGNSQRRPDFKTGPICDKAPGTGTVPGLISKSTSSAVVGMSSDRQSHLIQSSLMAFLVLLEGNSLANTLHHLANLHGKISYEMGRIGAVMPESVINGFTSRVHSCFAP